MTLDQETKMQSKATLVRKRKSLVSSAHVEKTQSIPAEEKARSVAQYMESKAAKKSKARYFNSPARQRRSMDIPFSGHEVELQVPAVHVPRPGWRILSMITLVLSIALMSIAAYSSKFEVSDIVVTGNKRISTEDISATLRLDEQNIFMVDPIDIEAKLRHAFPEIKSVSAAVELPNKIMVTLDERIPAMVWSYNEMSFWTDIDGKIFATRGDDPSLIRIEAADAPPLIPEEFFLSGPEAEIFNPGILGHIEENSEDEINYHMVIDPVVNNAIRKLSAMMPAGTTLVYNSKNGVGWNDPNGWNVYVGTDLSNLDQKLIVYRSVVAYVQQAHYKPSMISVEYVHAPYYRLEQ